MTDSLRVVQNSVPTFGEGTYSPGLANRMGLEVIQDFYTYCSLLGIVFQVRAGTITTPIAGDVVITNNAAEMASMALAGTTIMPCAANITFRAAAGTLNTATGKGVAVATMTGGTAFLPLNLKLGGPAATSTAMVGTAGGVAVAAELATTTNRYFSFCQPIAAGAWDTIYDWKPRLPPVMPGPSTFYIQIAATTTGQDYYASYEFIEAPSGTLL